MKIDLKEIEADVMCANWRMFSPDEMFCIIMLSVSSVESNTRTRQLTSGAEDKDKLEADSQLIYL